jgi:hypothetical protein
LNFKPILPFLWRVAPIELEGVSSFFHLICTPGMSYDHRHMASESEPYMESQLFGLYIDKRLRKDCGAKSVRSTDRYYARVVAFESGFAVGLRVARDNVIETHPQKWPGFGHPPKMPPIATAGRTNQAVYADVRDTVIQLRDLASQAEVPAELQKPALSELREIADQIDLRLREIERADPRTKRQAEIDTVYATARAHARKFVEIVDKYVK